MHRTGWVIDERFLRHDTGRWHPERADRLRAIAAEVERRALLKHLISLPVAPAPLDVVALNHPLEYIQRIKSECLEGRTYIDCPDSAVCLESFEVALLAVGGVLAACDALATGEIDNAFCAVRPPGHHAETDRAMGFCLFNNVAIAARYLQTRYGVGRIFILDYDVHHGNGTQHSFESDSNVFYCSIHQHPMSCYPGMGWETEHGRAAGVGTTLNITPQAGEDDAFYRAAFTQRILPAIRAFRPEALLISAGFDAHARDPLAEIQLTDDCFTWMNTELLAVADALCHGRLIAVLEGGYDLTALSTNVANCLEILLGINSNTGAGELTSIG